MMWLCSARRCCSEIWHVQEENCATKHSFVCINVMNMTFFNKATLVRTSINISSAYRHSLLLFKTNHTICNYSSNMSSRFNNGYRAEYSDGYFSYNSSRSGTQPQESYNPPPLRGTSYGFTGEHPPLGGPSFGEPNFCNSEPETNQSKHKDYYDILNISNNASDDDIKKAYRKL